MTYLRYLASLLQHKWYVFVAGLKTGVPIWRLVIHDWSKFVPSEFIPYARHFFSDEDVQLQFDYAWLHHQKFNPHHWQYWILINDEDGTYPLPAPETYVREMVADWMGASKTYADSWNMSEWLNENGPRMKLHEETERLIDKVLTEQGYFLTDNCMWSYMWSRTEAFV